MSKFAAGGKCADTAHVFPRCTGDVTVDASTLKVGDYAGLCALQGCYGMVAVTRRNDGFYIVMKSRTAENDSMQAPEKVVEGTEWETVRIKQSTVRLRIEADFAQMKDEAKFFIMMGNTIVNTMIILIVDTMENTDGSRLALRRSCILN